MTLFLLMDHLRLVASQSERNKMTTQNLAICFGPVLMLQSESDDPMDFHQPISILKFLLDLWPSKSGNVMVLFLLMLSSHSVFHLVLIPFSNCSHSFSIFFLISFSIQFLFRFLFSFRFPFFPHSVFHYFPISFSILFSFCFPSFSHSIFHSFLMSFSNVFLPSRKPRLSTDTGINCCCRYTVPFK